MILRLFYGVIFGLLTIQRMDVPTVAYHLEGFDSGYGAYIGFMIVDKTHTHPIAIRPVIYNYFCPNFSAHFRFFLYD